MIDILAFGAHPDDVELFAGGTMAKMAALGYSTGVVDMTRGELGTRGTPALRRKEARNAAEILGLKIRKNLGLPDGEVTLTPATRLKLIRVLREYRPRIVLTHYWDDRHPDHANTSRLVAEAVHHSGLAKIKTGQPRYRPPVLLFFKLPANVTPTFVVDISDYTERREAAIHAYQSQLFDPESREPSTVLSHPDFLSNIDAIHSYYGTLIGKRKGEAFFFKGVLEIQDIAAHFGKG
ncbi:MAG: bacillithiol biosynthesis deacetylase BshB1 [Acidobacteria bacterium]|nr:bacillithiol biosynthesis deacetylase BshB1 [Acidobacteriota bacterium]